MHLNPTKLNPFKLAYQKKLEQDNYNAWLQGVYIQGAIKSALFGGKAKYPEKPFGNKGYEQESTGVSAEIASKKFDAWSKLFNEKFKNDESDCVS